MTPADAKRAIEKAKREYGEQTFALAVRAMKLPQPVRQFRFCKRLWVFDFAWPDPQFKVALEVEGGIWRAKGAHNTGTAITRDIEKYNTALSMGWKVYRATIDMVKNGKALQWIEKALA